MAFLNFLKKKEEPGLEAGLALDIGTEFVKALIFKKAGIRLK